MVMLAIERTEYQNRKDWMKEDTVMMDDADDFFVCEQCQFLLYTWRISCSSGKHDLCKTIVTQSM